MDLHPSGRPSKASRWTNSRLNRRVPLASEASDDSEAGVDGGAPIKSYSSPVSLRKSGPSDAKDQTGIAKSSTTSACLSSRYRANDKTVKAVLSELVSHNETKATSAINADNVVTNGTTPSSANKTLAVALNQNAYSASTLHAHMIHPSMDISMTRNSQNVLNMPTHYSDKDPGHLSHSSQPIYHSGHKSADFAMIEQQILSRRKDMTAFLKGLPEQGLSTDQRSEIAQTPNSTQSMPLLPGSIGSGTHTRQESDSEASVDSPEIAAMLFGKLTASARGLSINSVLPPPEFSKETRISLGLEHRGPTAIIRSSPEIDLGKLLKSHKSRRPSPLNSVMNSSDEEDSSGGSSQSLSSDSRVTPSKGKGEDSWGGGNTLTPTSRGRANTPLSFDGYQQHLRSQSLIVEGHTNDMPINVRRHSEAVAVDQYAHGLPGSLSASVLTQRVSTPVRSSRQGARSCSPGHVNASPGAVVVRREPATPAVGPLDFSPVPDDVWQVRSSMLNQLTGMEGRPSLRDIIHPWFVPFSEKCRFIQQSNAGVIRISNIPYEVSRAEIFAFLGRSADTLNDKNEPVHIIMDRTTSKTNECYVEFPSFDEAVSAVSRYQNAIDNGAHVPKIGSRNVEVTISNQAKLMQKLFPLAKGIVWEEMPFRIIRDSPHSWDNFKGFVTEEEMTMLCKHIEGYNNPVFAKKCPERPYECMISTIKKYPWHMPEYVTIKERGYLYEASLKMVIHLQKLISKGEKPERLTPQLLNRLAEAVVSSPGFSVSQKDNVAFKANMPERKLGDLGQPRFAELWRHLQVIHTKQDVPIDLVEYYIALVREETTRIADLQGISQQQRLLAEQSATSAYWGFF
ncbi:hypothetical protein F4805DRAFT_457927 [Annulohypoxylon moriforme]|nr:hypothetical protein F4805DRAFT_457927 [Annulohypoxylon moriforme]